MATNVVLCVGDKRWKAGKGLRNGQSRHLYDRLPGFYLTKNCCISKAVLDINSN